MLTNLIVEIISQYIHTSNHHVVHLTLNTMLYVTTISIRLENFLKSNLGDITSLPAQPAILELSLLTHEQDSSSLFMKVALDPLLFLFPQPEFKVDPNISSSKTFSPSASLLPSNNHHWCHSFGLSFIVAGCISQRWLQNISHSTSAM